MENRPGDERFRPPTATPWVPGTTVHTSPQNAPATGVPPYTAPRHTPRSPQDPASPPYPSHPPHTPHPAPRGAAQGAPPGTAPYTGLMPPPGMPVPGGPGRAAGTAPQAPGHNGPYEGWAVPQYREPSAPRRGRGLWVLATSAAAAAVALAALAAGVVIVATAPPTEPAPTGENLAVHYDDRLFEPPAPVTVDIADHPLYDAAVPEEVSCGLPELDSSSDDSWTEFATATGRCLDELWAPVFDDLGLSASTPEITVTRESPDSDEDEGYTLAYYESDFERITVVLPNVRTLSGQIPSRAREDVWIALMSHEYGHHVQYVTGILDISHNLRYKSATEEEELDTLRRTELQAECMAGIGLRAITGADEQALQRVNANFNGGGDLSTHGTATNRAHWLEAGWNDTSVGGCNTYDAPSDEVT